MFPMLQLVKDFRIIVARPMSIDAWILVRKVLLAIAMFSAFETVAANVALDKNEAKIIECGVYLAPSSIPGAGIGMFVGNRSIGIDEIVTGEDIVIPIVERKWHVEERLRKEKFLWNEYTWNSDEFPSMEEEIGEELQSKVQVASPGVGAAANSYLSLVNIEDSWVRIGRAEVPPDSPGQGAFTTYHGRTFFATEEMEAGQEIFVSYGEDYFTSRVWAYGYLPMPDDFQDADTLLAKALLVTKNNENLAKESHMNGECSAAGAAITENACREPIIDPIPFREEVWNDLHALMKDISDNIFTKSRIMNAIPRNPSSAEGVLEKGGTGRQDYNRSVKPLEWLEEHGQCADNIAVDISKTPHAGRGAFATRFIPSGKLVSPAPLVHIEDINMMVMFMEHIYDEDDDLVPNRSGAYTWQLILNYCFAHHQSTLLLCPYGLLSSLINHSSGENANTKIQWSDFKRMRHPEWMEQPIEKWSSEYHTGLQLDYVATRDIQEGEEILIDYGDLWQKAWDKHVDGFRFEDLRSEYYRPSYELNDLIHDSDFGELRTENERDYRLDGVQLRCRGWYLWRHGFDTSDFKNKSPMCSIVRKLGEGDTYLVRIIEWIDNDKDRRWEYESDDSDMVWGLPRDAFFFEDLPYSRDIHQEWAFRHPMMIPDEMFPEAWKNVEHDKEHVFLRFKEKILVDVDEDEDDEDDDDYDEDEDDYDGDNEEEDEEDEDEDNENDEY